MIGDKKFDLAVIDEGLYRRLLELREKTPEELTRDLDAAFPYPGETMLRDARTTGLSVLTSELGRDAAVLIVDAVLNDPEIRAMIAKLERRMVELAMNAAISAMPDELQEVYDVPTP